MAPERGGPEFERRLERLERAEASFKRLVMRRRDHPLFTTELTIQQLRMLLVLGTDGPMPTHEFAEELGTGVTTVTGMVDRLAARGMVRRVPDEHDRRVRRVELTEQGREFYDTLDQFGRDERRRILAQLEPRILDNLIEATEAIQQVLPAERSRGPGSGR